MQTGTVLPAAAQGARMVWKQPPQGALHGQLASLAFAGPQDPGPRHILSPKV